MCLTYFSRCSKHIRSLDTFNFLATIFFRFSTDVWLSTLTEKQPPVVVLIFNVICGKFISLLPHPMCCWISCESLPIFVHVYLFFIFVWTFLFCCSCVVFGVLLCIPEMRSWCEKRTGQNQRGKETLGFFLFFSYVWFGFRVFSSRLYFNVLPVGYLSLSVFLCYARLCCTSSSYFFLLL